MKTTLVFALFLVLVACAMGASLADLDSCLCIDIADQVCGADGKIYGTFESRSVQFATMKTTLVFALFLVLVACAMGASLERGCYCIDIFDPVCGADGKIYGNSCYMACANVEPGYACFSAVLPEH
ncbi:unnamed protein product [Chrysodeixis includens]|uniref:Kazal-like domain-containing protein n=1 Tax=Chrysodeixis includens TaxID=689277 RepID=A0A9P0FTU3_CHRIL|nr:unnamed protein product [Chrysodeixis includens]